MSHTLLKHLSVLNYRNLEATTFDFEATINCFVGNNGVGKTNLLDAIYHLSFGKSYFNPVATQNIRHGSDFYMLNGVFDKNGREENIVCSYKKGTKKSIKRNGKLYDKFSEHIGLLPVVIISPADRNVILEGSEARRKFVDGVISQSDKSYLASLIAYQKVLGQRNSLLKYFATNQTFDKTALAIYNEQLANFGNTIFEKRKAFLKIFIPIFKKQYQLISKGNEETNIKYNSKLAETSFVGLLEEAMEKDRVLQYTSVGVHKDDLDFTIKDHPIKKFGSQGQQKSFLIAMKLAQFAFMAEKAKTTPILLLDDIFDKLDENRVAQLVDLVNQEQFGQLFISDTHKERTEKVVGNTRQAYKLFSL